MTKLETLQVQNADLKPISSAEGKRGILIELHLKPAQPEPLRIALTIDQAEDLAKAIMRLADQAHRAVLAPKGIQ